MPDIRTVDRLEAIPNPLPDADVVVLDVIIASTTIVSLLDRGARYVVPFVEVERSRAFEREVEDALLVGEDGGAAIDGFRSPLPSKLPAAEVADRAVGVRTTNGTRAFGRIDRQNDVFVASTINAAAVAAELATRERDVLLVAAGRYGSPTPEDRAGVRLVERYYERILAGEDTEEVDVSDIRETIDESDPAAWLRELGLQGDLETILDFNATETVPRLEDGRLVG